MSHYDDFVHGVIDMGDMALKFNPHNMNHQLIVAGLAGMIDDEGLTFHQAMTVLEDIKRQTFPALSEMAAERREDS